MYRGLVFFAAAAACVAASDSDSFRVSFLQADGSDVTDFDHDCKHRDGYASVHLEIIPDPNLIQQHREGYTPVNWRLDGLGDNVYSWQETPDLCNVMPGRYRVHFKAADDKIMTAVKEQEIDVNSGGTTVLWLRTSSRAPVSAQRFGLLMAKATKEVYIPPVSEHASVDNPVTDFQQALLIEQKEIECHTTNGNCSGNATCSVDVKAVQHCSCNEGYTGSGKECHVIPSCTILNIVCTNHSVCKMISDTAGSCFCAKGYVGLDNTTSPICHEANPCLTAARGGCHKNAFCEKVGPGNATCACNRGFVGTGKKCALKILPSRNETNSANATANATVINTIKTPEQVVAEADVAMTSRGVSTMKEAVDDAPVENGTVVENTTVVTGSKELELKTNGSVVDKTIKEPVALDETNSSDTT